MEEAQIYMAMYIVFNSCDESILNNAEISRPLYNFITGRTSRIKTIIAVSIKFAFIFTTILATQVIEINKKFRASSEEQKQKLIKLYSSQERRTMIVNNAANFALQKIQSQRSEYMDTVKNFKAFVAKSHNILTVHDMFQIEYPL
jgi:hypothetical protein